MMIYMVPYEIDDLSGLSVESLPGLGMSIPSTMGHNGHAMPPNLGQIYEGASLWL